MPISSNPNISFEYLYRDSGNNKSYGTLVFSNHSAVSLAEIEKRLGMLWMSPDKNFEAERWGLPTLYFAEGDEELDHGWHEFVALAFTDDIATHVDITTFLAMVLTTSAPSHTSSPKNARRLLAALLRAQSNEGEPQSIDGLMHDKN